MKTDSATPTSTVTTAPVRVWDWPVRLLHWSLVIGVAVSWWSSDDNGPTHENAGYVVIGALVARLLWGFFGSHYARFRQFVRGPAATRAYARQVLHGHAPRYIGHNPLGAAMVVALLGNLSLLGFTGWLYTTDLFWGYGWLANLHKYLGWLLLGLIALHVLGMLLTCWQHRENLVRAMFTGRKTGAQGDDVA